jgi:hypothetical protein
MKKTLICEVCEVAKPRAEIKRGRYCCILVCESCRQENADEGDDEEWLDVDE